MTFEIRALYIGHDVTTSTNKVLPIRTCLNAVRVSSVTGYNSGTEGPTPIISPKRVVRRYFRNKTPFLGKLFHQLLVPIAA